MTHEDFLKSQGFRKCHHADGKTFWLRNFKNGSLVFDAIDVDNNGYLKDEAFHLSPYFIRCYKDLKETEADFYEMMTVKTSYFLAIQTGDLKPIENELSKKEEK